jgi:hypothetical protein
MTEGTPQTMNSVSSTEYKAVVRYVALSILLLCVGCCFAIPGLYFSFLALLGDDLMRNVVGQPNPVSFKPFVAVSLLSAFAITSCAIYLFRIGTKNRRWNKHAATNNAA